MIQKTDESHKPPKKQAFQYDIISYEIFLLITTFYRIKKD